MSQQWRHTEPDPKTGLHPLAPWPVHPAAPLDVDLVAELLSELRGEVTTWTELERGHVERGNREMADWCGAHVEAARHGLSAAERLIARANHRATLRARAGRPPRAAWTA
ncbi:hypothetical protein [Blastococcus sp. CT_GayMR16]|uniref:hypothetical protein n=1 Tax=Blastococcus sp. CT_GayMR16 TaxID=2559607 RepID=UPI001073D1BA|nr:hypothetical protein [Blastococcus sp. CT_GayMR16]TFV83181.1 hypothetical protein E4P38_21225 [Blastococcus sp. CT_GayMR16]